MPRVFPGMDPYIELSDMWTGFHNVLISFCSLQLNALLPSNYIALVEKRVELVESTEDFSRDRKPDIAVSRDVDSATAGTGALAVLPEIQPAKLTLPRFEESPEAYIDIQRLPERELITSIEVLSPSNKSRSGHGEYWAKRAAMIRQGAHLVEIDLLLEGRRLPLLEPHPLGDYFAYISRGDRRPSCDVYAWTIRRPLPKLPVPLKSPDADVMLDLDQAALQTFEGGRYSSVLRYDLPVPRSLRVADQEWAAELAAAARKRK